jgi:hypothetical protein
MGKNLLSFSLNYHILPKLDDGEKSESLISGFNFFRDLRVKI